MTFYLNVIKKTKFKFKVRDKETGKTIAGATVTIYADGAFVDSKTTNSYGETDWFEVTGDPWITGKVTAPGYKDYDIEGFYAHTVKDQTVTVYLEPTLPPHPVAKIKEAWVEDEHGNKCYEGGSLTVTEGEEITAKVKVKNEGKEGTIWFWIYDYNEGGRIAQTSKYFYANETQDMELTVRLTEGEHRLSLRVGHELDNPDDWAGD